MARYDRNASKWRAMVGQKVTNLGVTYTCIGGKSVYVGPKIKGRTKTILPLWESSCVDCGNQHQDTAMHPRCPSCRRGKGWKAATKQGRRNQAMAWLRLKGVAPRKGW